jgi:RimJ/RimL family protein N-acetyltransferase
MNQSPNPRIYLRALDISDLERVFIWHNDADLYEHLGGNFHWVSHSMEEEWFRRHCTYSTNEANLAICISETHEHIGNLYLRDIDWVARHAELHIFIGAKDHRGLGYGEEAMQLAITHAFRDLGLQRVYLYVLASNEPAQKLYQRCGFIEEGRLRQHAYKQSQFEDVILMGILRAEWKG